MIIDQQVENFRAALVKFDIDDIDSLCFDFKNMLQEQKPPSMYWEFLDSGAFKECYAIPTSDKIVVKFAVNSNSIIDDEEETLSLAKDKGLEHFFPRSIYIPLDISIPSGVYKDCGVNKDSDYIIIQEKVEPIHDSKSIWSSHAPDRLFDSDGEFLPLYALKSCYLNSLTWCTFAIQYYGVKHFKELCKFITQEEIDDLGSNNVGFLLSNNQPVIFDWIFSGSVYHC